MTDQPAYDAPCHAEEWFVLAPDGRLRRYLPRIDRLAYGGSIKACRDPHRARWWHYAGAGFVFGFVLVSLFGG